MGNRKIARKRYFFAVKWDNLIEIWWKGGIIERKMMDKVRY
jgi:hypothetical protein